MHHHLEIILPPVDDVEKLITEVMAPFDENNEDAYHAFWDWYVIGGRWAGEHLRASVDPEKLSQFYKDLEDRKITVSGIVCGKKTLKPEDQIPTVDALWRQYFPDSELNTCPLFSHFNDQYKDNCLDVDPLGQINIQMTASRVIIAGPNYNDSSYEAKFMVEVESWNGCNYIDTTWDGKIEGALALYSEYTKRWNDEHRAKNTPTKDWYIATIDYHS
jgi:hypothetical protein